MSINLIFRWFKLSLYNNNCYICSEQTRYLSPCNCNNLHLHQKCFEENLIRNNYSEEKTRCSICLQKIVEIERIPCDNNNKLQKCNDYFYKSICSTLMVILLYFIVSIIVSIIWLYIYKYFVYVSTKEFDNKININELFVSMVVFYLFVTIIFLIKKSNKHRNRIEILPT